MYGDEEEALFHSYPHAMYYVQSPSTLSHANSAADGRNHDDSSLLSPYNHTPSAVQPNNSTSSLVIVPTPTTAVQEASRFTLSRCSSSRGSNNSFPLHLHDSKKLLGGYNVQSNLDNNHRMFNDDGCCDIAREEAAADDDEDEKNGGGVQRRRRRYSSLCLCSQIGWRLVASLGTALLFFFLFTRPPPPKMSLQMGGVPEFVLGEGTDSSGVITKILSTNCSVDLEVENRSKFFGLHIRPPTIEMAFGRFSFATSRGPRLYVEANSLTTFKLYIGTRNKAMYGAGRAMQDMLDSGKGLPLIIRVQLSSSVQVIWKIVRPRYRHHALCLLVLREGYDKRHHTYVYNSNCTTL